MALEKPEIWVSLVAEACHAETYKTIVQAMFNDNIVTDARLMVLEEYTRDVCERYPNIAEDICCLYVQLLDQLTRRWYHTLPGIFQGLCQCIANVLMACLSCI